MIPPFKDNDIEILGAHETKNDPPRSRKPRRRTKWTYIIVAIIVLMLTILGLSLIFIRYAFREPGVQTASDVTEPTEISAWASQRGRHATRGVRKSVTGTIHEYADSINDVAFTVFEVGSKTAKVVFETPDSLDRSIVLALPAADYRADNGEIVGEFIYNGKYLSRGTRKPGYVYINPDGVISIGNGIADEKKELALKEGGTFFRQYALVMDGDVQPNLLRGKAKRRALGFLNGKPVVIMTRERESLYEFSQALADYGVSHAVYLPGGDGLLKIRSDARNLYENPYPSDSKYVNYLVFTN